MQTILTTPARNAKQRQPKPTLPLFYSPIFWGANQWERLKCADELTFFFRKI